MKKRLQLAKKNLIECKNVIQDVERECKVPKKEILQLSKAIKALKNVNLE
jgi:hypothetical protein